MVVELIAVLEDGKTFSVTSSHPSTVEELALALRGVVERNTGIAQTKLGELLARGRQLGLLEPGVDIPNDPW